MSTISGQKINLSKVAKKIYCMGVEEITPVLDEYAIYKIDIDGIAFEMLTYLRKSSPVLYVLGQGAVNVDRRKKYGLPLFQRWSWIETFPYSVIILNDPTLYIDNLEVGWFQGTKDKCYLPIACKIIDKFIKLIGLSSKDIIFSGSSAGGFTSLMMAGSFDRSSVFVNNPQTDIRKYYKRLVSSLFDSIFPNISQEEIYGEQMSARLSVVDYYRSINSIPNIYYVQNTQDTFHMEHHFIPFIDELNKMILNNSDFQGVKLFMELYSDTTSRHNPLSKAEYIKRLKRVLFLLDKA